jgi:hypothetical protein
MILLIPSKIVRTSIKDVGESVLHPKSREDVHTVLENYPVVTNKSCVHFLTILFFQLASAGQIMFVYSFLYPDNDF